MTVQLSQPEYRRLTPIIQTLADFATARDRRLVKIDVIPILRSPQYSNHPRNL